MPVTSKEEALYQRLSTAPNIVAAGVAAKVYPVRRPEGATTPLIEFQRISTPTDHTQDSGTTDSPRFQISIWADDPDEAREIAEAVHTDVVGHRGTYGDRTISVLKADQREDIDDATQRYRQMIDVVVW